MKSRIPLAATLAFILTMSFAFTAEAVLHPTLGRFMQRDSYNKGLASGGYQDGMNQYQYLKSDPINAVDPSGNLYFKSVGIGPQVYPDGKIGAGAWWGLTLWPIGMIWKPFKETMEVQS